MSPLLLSLITFVIVMGGACLGAVLRNTLPGHHLVDDAKELVRLGSGLVGTMAALVLGLLIASAKSSYDTQSTQVQHVTADIVLIDRILAQYGPEARPSRDLLRHAVSPLVARIWQESSSRATKDSPFEATTAGEDLYTRIYALSPANDVQRSLKERAIQVSTDLAQVRLLLFEQTSNSIPSPFLAMLVSWLAIIFASFSLFSKLNLTTGTILTVFALSASGAIFLILEMNQPFSGLMQVSSIPLRNALAPLAP